MIRQAQDTNSGGHEAGGGADDGIHMCPSSAWGVGATLRILLIKQRLLMRAWTMM